MSDDLPCVEIVIFSNRGVLAAYLKKPSAARSTTNLLGFFTCDDAILLAPKIAELLETEGTLWLNKNNRLGYGPAVAISGPLLHQFFEGLLKALAER